MLGGCIENSWLSARLNTQGFDQAHIGQIFAGYGIVVAITSPAIRRLCGRFWS